MQIDMRPQMPKMWDQKNLGSCTAHAAGAGYCYEMLKCDKIDTWDPSRLYIYYNARRYAKNTMADSGATIRDVVKGLVGYGACKEDAWKYDAHLYNEKPSKACYAFGRNCVVNKYYSLNASEIQHALASGYPVVFGMLLRQSFEDESGKGVAKTGVMHNADGFDPVIGGHALLIVGYDLPKRMYLIRNSWGDGWGIDGYFWAPFEYIEDPNQASDFWVIQGIKGEV